MEATSTEDKDRSGSARAYCPICSKSFSTENSSKNDLIKHLEDGTFLDEAAHPDPGTRLFPCGRCRISAFESPEILITHLVQNHGEEVTKSRGWDRSLLISNLLCHPQM